MGGLLNDDVEGGVGRVRLWCSLGSNNDAFGR